MSITLNQSDKSAPVTEYVQSPDLGTNGQQSPGRPPNRTTGAKKRGGRKSNRPAQTQEPEAGQAALPVLSEEKPNASPTILKIADIAIDPTIQSRAGLNEKAVLEYAERMKAGDVFPPLNVFRVEDKILLADGFHTYHAAIEAGFSEIQAVIHEGSRRDAVKLSLRANTSHGLPRTNEDKRRAATLALQEFTDLSDGAIAEMIKVSQAFVTKIRHKLKTVLSCQVRTGRDGKKRKSPLPKATPEQAHSTAAEEEPASYATEHDLETPNSGEGGEPAPLENSNTDDSNVPKAEPWWWMLVRDEVGPCYLSYVVQAGDYEEAKAKAVKQAQGEQGDPESGGDNGFSAAYGFTRSELLDAVEEIDEASAQG